MTEPVIPEQTPPADGLLPSSEAIRNRIADLVAESRQLRRILPIVEQIEKGPAACPKRVYRRAIAKPAGELAMA